LNGTFFSASTRRLRCANGQALALYKVTSDMALPSSLS
jgi:hypothetical protein